MPFPRTQINQLLTTASNGVTAQVRGAALEQAASLMFCSVPGVITPVMNVVDYATAGEIDILFPNMGPRNGFWFLDKAFYANVKIGTPQLGSRRSKYLRTECVKGIVCMEFSFRPTELRATPRC